MRHFHDWRELTTTYPAKPVFEKPPRPAHFLIFPELGKQLFGRPSARHLQMQIIQLRKLLGLRGTEILRVIEPQ